LHRSPQGRGRHRGDGPPRLPVRPDARPPDDRADRQGRGRHRPRLTAQGRRLRHRARHAVVEVRRQSLPHGRGELLLRSPPLRVSRWLPRLQPGCPRGGELPDELRRLRVRPGDHLPGGGRGLPHGRDRRARALLSRSLLGELLRLVRVRAQDPLGGDAALPAQEWPQALATAHDAAGPLQPARSRHGKLSVPLSMVRLLDLLALVSGLALLSSLVYWWHRPEDLFLLFLGIVAVRLLVAPVAVPALRPRRVLVAGIAVYAVTYSFITITRHLTF